MAVGIEHSYVFFQAVALLTECVDRNGYDSDEYRLAVSRTPYGVRG